MTELNHTTVWRGGVTAKYWYGAINYVSISSASELRFRFTMPSKGGGDTNVEMQVGPEDFPTILEAMMLVDRQAAMEAMSIELSRQVSAQRERRKSLLRSGEGGCAGNLYRSPQ
jgi:hypothetical protein